MVERKLARPVEEVTRALRHNVGLYSLTSKMPESKRVEYAALFAKISISELRRLGFINDIGLVAINAEESGDEGNVVDLTKGAGK